MADLNTPDAPAASTLAGTAAPATSLAGSPASTSVPVQPVQTQDTPSTQTVQTLAGPSYTAPPAPHRGLMGTIGHNIVNTLGKPDVPGTIDDTGKYVQAAAVATPGNLFKNLLMGALSGMSNLSEAPKGSGMAGGIAAGLAGGIRSEQQTDADNRAKAQADFTNKNAATAATNQALLMKANIAHINLQAEGQAQINAQNKTLFPLDVQQRIASIAGTDAQHEKTMRDMGYTPAPVQANGSNAVNGYADATPQMQQDLATGRISITPSNSPNSTAAVHAWIAPPDDAPIPTDIKINTYKLADAAYVKANPGTKLNDTVINTDIPTYTLKAHSATAGQARIAVAQMYAQRTALVNDYLKQDDTRSTINEHNAAAGASNAQMTLIKGEIKDKDQARQVTQDWGASLLAPDVNNDPVKALAYLKQHFPKSAEIAASAESQAIATKGSTETKTVRDPITGQATEVTVQKISPLFSAGGVPTGNSGAPASYVKLSDGSAAKAGTFLAEADTRAKNSAAVVDAGVDYYQGASRLQVNEELDKSVKSGTTTEAQAKAILDKLFPTRYAPAK